MENERLESLEIFRSITKWQTKNIQNIHFKCINIKNEELYTGYETEPFGEGVGCMNRKDLQLAYAP